MISDFTELFNEPYCQRYNLCSQCNTEKWSYILTSPLHLFTRRAKLSVSWLIRKAPNIIRFAVSRLALWPESRFPRLSISGLVRLTRLLSWHTAVLIWQAVTSIAWKCQIGSNVIYNHIACHIVIVSIYMQAGAGHMVFPEKGKRAKIFFGKGGFSVEKQGYKNKKNWEFSGKNTLAAKK